MNTFVGVSVPAATTTRFQLQPPATLTIAGTLSLRDPSAEFGAFFKALHHAALTDGTKEVRVDVANLSFVNSSSIRLFIDWAAWLRQCDPPRRYKLKFITDRRVTWQRTAFAALLNLAGEVVNIESTP